MVVDIFRLGLMLFFISNVWFRYRLWFSIGLYNDFGLEFKVKKPIYNQLSQSDIETHMTIIIDQNRQPKPGRTDDEHESTTKTYNIEDKPMLTTKS